ncbi:MAG TPA: hypothetical protein VFT88_11510, partial [Acidobacteriaceae bacterium]|nr:hypothetical protein [Acidobacteriaceae bacterium]
IAGGIVLAIFLFTGIVILIGVALFPLQIPWWLLEAKQSNVRPKQTRNVRSGALGVLAAIAAGFKERYPDEARIYAICSANPFLQ